MFHDEVEEQWELRQEQQRFALASLLPAHSPFDACFVFGAGCVPQLLHVNACLCVRVPARACLCARALDGQVLPASLQRRAHALSSVAAAAAEPPGYGVPRHDV